MGLRPCWCWPMSPRSGRKRRASVWSQRCAPRPVSNRIPGFVALGTRPADPEHWFAKLLAGSANYAQSHAAGPDDPKFQRRTWIKANPSLPHMPDLEAAIRVESGQAKQDPALLAAFDALRLNLGTMDVEVSLLIDAGPVVCMRRRGARRTDRVSGGSTWGHRQRNPQWLVTGRVPGGSNASHAFLNRRLCANADCGMA